RELDPRKTRDYLELIARENHRLSRLIENFLTFSRIERHRQRLTLAYVAPSDVVQAAADVVRDRFDALDCRLQVEAASGLPTITADFDALVTVLVNLLDNALKYTRAEKRIRMSARKEAGQIRFEVEDNGIGIAPRDQRRIFRRFYQVDRSLARETGGVGLG